MAERNLGVSRRRRGAALVAATAVTVALLAAPTRAAAEPTEQAGHLVLVGGALNENQRILSRFVELADPDENGPETAHIAIVTAASYPAQDEEEAADPEQDNATANGHYYADLFEDLGATTVRVPIDEAVNYAGDPYIPANADDPRIAQAVHESTGVWFGGGDQMRYIRTLFDCEPADREAFTDCTDTVVMAAVRAVLDAGGVVGGTSAGLTVQQGAAMVTGGEPYEGWRDGARPGYFEGRQLGYVPYGGFGFFGWGMLDSHFATWGRQARMIRLAMDERVGFDHVVGLDETTALVIDRAAGTGRVIGRNGASLLDVTDAVLEHRRVEDVRWSYLTRGDRLDLSTWKVTRAKSAEDVAETGPAPPLWDDIWDTIEDDHTYSMRDLGVALVSSTARKGKGVTYEDDPRFKTILVSDRHAEAWTTSKGDVSFDQVELRIKKCCAEDVRVGADPSRGQVDRRAAGAAR